MTKSRERNVWQVGGGPSNRSYADLFLKHGVALIGPGDPGPWSPERYTFDLSLRGRVGRFACEAIEGDVFLLRSGRSAISAIGLVADEYQYMDQFDDVNGWDLQHCRRVRWCSLPNEYQFGNPVFGANPTRFSRVQNEEVLDYVDRFLNSPPIHWQTASLPPLPPEEPALDETHIPANLRQIVAEAKDLVRIYSDEQICGAYPCEDELICHLAVPFLRALGWPPEDIGVKWQFVDIAVFKALPRIPGNCQFVIEAKRLGAGVEGALDQAIDYVKNLGARCDIVVTDGVRYRIYSAEFEYKAVAYANLVRLKKSAVDLFDRMKNA